MTEPWEHFQHGADVGVRGSGATLAEAFENAAMAMTAAAVDPESVRLVEAVDIVCEAPDEELLLPEWLNALVYEMAVRRMLFARFEVHIDGYRLQARAWGERVERERHQPAVEIKGATYTQLSVGRDEQGIWHAQCVVDV